MTALMPVSTSPRYEPPAAPVQIHKLLLGALLCCAVATARPEQSEFKLAPWPHALTTPRFELRSVDDQPRTLASFAGSVVVVYFGFLSCPDLCPATLLKLSHAMRQLGPTRRPVIVLFITLDPTHDKPAALKAYVRAFDPRIVALTGSTAAINEAAAAFFVQHSRVNVGGRDTIDHSTGVFLLDAQGRLQAVGSTESSIDDFVHDLRLLAAH